MKKSFALLGLVVTGIFLLGSLFSPLRVAAFDPFGAACQSNTQQGSSQSSVCTSDSKDPITGAEKEGVLLKAVHILSFITGIAAVIAIIIAGFEYVISAGDSTKIDRAKNALVAALIGLGIVLVAETLVRFIIGKF